MGSTSHIYIYVLVEQDSAPSRWEGNTFTPHSHLIYNLAYNSVYYTMAASRAVMKLHIKKCFWP